MNQSHSGNEVNVFVYGTLMFEPVWSRVVENRYNCTPAVLSDHRRHRLRGETFPGVIACPGRKVEGMVYHQVSPVDLVKLDAFEGADYARRSALVQRLDGSTLSADFYLWLKPAQTLDLDWQADWFVQEGMDSFMATYVVPATKTGRGR